MMDAKIEEVQNIRTKDAKEIARVARRIARSKGKRIKMSILVIEDL